MSTDIQPAEKAAWHQWRGQGIGASDAPVVAGLSRYKSRYQLWLEKTGQGSPRPPNEAMKWGLRLEDVIAEAYRERTGTITHSAQVQRTHPNYEWMRCTLDGLTAENRVVELKAAGLGTARGLGEDGDSDSLPNEWILQVQHQLAVTGLEWADVAVFMPQLELRIYPVRRDDDLIGSLIDTESEFWGQVCNRVEPEPETLEDLEDWHRRVKPKGTRVAIENDEIMTTAHYYKISGDNVKKWEQERDDAKYELIRALAGNEFGDLPDGRVIRLQSIEVAERDQHVKAHTQLRLTIKEPKE